MTAISCIFCIDATIYRAYDQEVMNARNVCPNDLNYYAKELINLCGKPEIINSWDHS